MILQIGHVRQRHLYPHKQSPLLASHAFSKHLSIAFSKSSSVVIICMMICLITSFRLSHLAIRKRGIDI